MSPEEKTDELVSRYKSALAAHDDDEMLDAIAGLFSLYEGRRYDKSRLRADPAWLSFLEVEYGRRIESSEMSPFTNKPDDMVLDAMESLRAPDCSCGGKTGHTAHGLRCARCGELA